MVSKKPRIKEHIEAKLKPRVCKVASVTIFPFRIFKARVERLGGMEDDHISFAQVEFLLLLLMWSKNDLVARNIAIYRGTPD